MSGTDQDPPCPHDAGWAYDIGRERWEAEDVGSIHAEATCRWCPMCGELWFREVDGEWFQKYWTAEELAQIEENAKEYDWVLREKTDE